MRLVVVLLLLSPALSPDSTRRTEVVSPFIPIVVENSNGLRETVVGLLDTGRGRLVWDRTIRRSPYRFATISAYGNAIQVGIEEGEGDAGVTYGLALKSGELLFEHPGLVGAYLQVNGRRSVVLYHPQGLTCLDPESGRSLWFWKGKGHSYIPTLGHQRLVAFLDGGEGGVAVLDATTGAELWRRSKARNETFLYGLTKIWSRMDNDVVELDADSGKEVRSFRSPQAVKDLGTDGRFVYCLFRRSLQALDAQTLQPAWSWAAPADTSSLFATRYGLHVAIESGKRIHVLNPDSGKSLAVVEVDGADGSGSTFTRDSLYVHFAYQLKRSWTFTIVDGIRGGILWQGDARGFCGSGRGMGHAWSGDKIWRVPLKAETSVWSTTVPGAISEVTVHCGTLVVVAGQGVAGIDPLSGDRLWQWTPSFDPKRVVMGYWRAPD
jgi:outer membrane protein assembly factor BamB